MLQTIINKLGFVIQAYVIFSIHLSVYFEVTSIDEYLLSISVHDRSFNHLTGWPLYILTIYYYYKAITVPAGRLRNKWDLYSSDENMLTNCFKCKISKPYRTSHCRRCDTCIVRRDHHCLFTNNCVGYDNFKSFFWFTFFGFFGTLHFVIRALQWEYEWYYGDNIIDYSDSYAILFGLHMYSMMGLLGLLAHMFQKSFRNVLRNIHSMDTWLNQGICANNENNIYDLGFIQNWSIAFGINPLFWFSSQSSQKYGVPLGPEFPTWPG